MAEIKKDEYVESDAVRAAKAMLEQQQAMKTGGYQSQWQTSLNDAMDKILNRDKFSYDLNGDALYQQYKDRYVKQGQQAMMDTMGQASTMTGGYGNSYAQTAGQQTYQNHLLGLNDKMPELYQMALDRYNREGQDLYNQFGLLADREAMDYGRYRDQVADSQWQAEFDEAVKRFLATADPEVRAYYENYGKTPGEGEAGNGNDPTLSLMEKIFGGSAAYGPTSGRGYGGSSNKAPSDIVEQVIRGDWGNGEERRRRLTEAGYDYATIQAAVNKAIRGDEFYVPKDPFAEMNPMQGPGAGMGFVANNAIASTANNVAQMAIANYVKSLLDSNSTADPRAMINADSKLSESEKAYALEVLQAYIDAGYLN